MAMSRKSVSGGRSRSSGGGKRRIAAEGIRRRATAAPGQAPDRLAFGRFVRRDVLKEMKDRKSRHPVLIELRDDAAFPTNQRIFGELSKMSLDEHRTALVSTLEKLVGQTNGRLEDARIDPLRRFVAARLTTSELDSLTKDTSYSSNVYCVWKNTRKRKLLARSTSVVHVPAARTSYGATGRGITWAVLDTGVYEGHPHFRTRATIDEVWDCTKRGAVQAITKAKDKDGHGTHVSGIIAGETQNARQTMTGAAPDAKLRVYKVLDDEGEGEDAWIIKALDHIATMNETASSLVVHGVNLSLGGYFDATVYGCGHSPICQELRRLWMQGVVVCVACGNEGQIEVMTEDGTVDLNTAMSVGDPANLEECIAVGSVNADRPHVYGISYFSSRGPTADGRIKPDVVAPGEGIRSCASDGNDYVEMSGTSMACPHVSGLIAAFLSVRREFIGRPDMVKRILLANCTDIGRDRNHQGAGIPNLMRMLTST